MLQPYADGVSTRRTSLIAALAHRSAVVTTDGVLTEPLWRQSGAVALVDSGDLAAIVRRLYVPDGRSRATRTHGSRCSRRALPERLIAARTLTLCCARAADAGSRPSVSVVIATTNRPAYLRSARSLVLQTATTATLKSRDSTTCGSDTNREIARGFADPRIVYHRNEKRLRIAANHIQAFRSLVSGKFIAILNDDDESTERFNTVPIRR